MRMTTSFSAALTALALLAGCVVTTNNTNTGGSGGSAGSGGGSISDHESTCFEPIEDSGMDAYNATFSAPTHTVTFTVPKDPAGGILELEGMGKQLFLTLLTDKGADADIVKVSSADNGVARVRVAAAPGVTYSVLLEETSVVDGEPPVPVSFIWKYASIMDCFEPNDTSADAREMALDKPLNALMFAGYVEKAWPTVEAHEDWYVVKLDKPGKIRATLDTPLALLLDILAADGKTIIGGGQVLETEPGSIEAEVEAGTYYVRIQVPGALSYNDFDSGGALPKNWTTPYTLTVTRQ